MSLREYELAKQLSEKQLPFRTLLMAALWEANSVDCLRLGKAFPEVWGEIYARRFTPSGVLATDVIDEVENVST